MSVNLAAEMLSNAEITLADELEVLDNCLAMDTITMAEYIDGLADLGIGYAVTDEANRQFVILS